MKIILTIRLLLFTIIILLAIMLAQELHNLSVFHCVTMHQIGICYWYRGK